MSKKSAKGGKKVGVTEKWDAEDVIQAVLLADSFNYRFLPITVEQPRALLPLVNTPLINYSLELLVANGVKEIFVYCKAHADKMKEYIEASEFCAPSCPATITVLSSSGPISIGDVLRDIDSRSLIRSDFILVSGDLVANLDLRAVIAAHKERRKVDKMAIMTVVYKQASPNHRTRSSEDDILVVVDVSNDRLVHYEKTMKKRHMTVPLDVLKKTSSKVVDLRYDLLDCHISVCSPHVPAIFSDNFDYETRDHFVRGILVNEEILGNNIFVHVITDQYAARVSNLHTYDAISKDVIHRWVYPLVPDKPMFCTSPPYSYSRRNVYMGQNITLARGSVLEEDVVIGPHCSLGANSSLTKTVVGKGCKIGENVIISGSYLWDGVVVEDGCRITQSIVCNSAIIKAGSTLQPGCIISYNVVIGPGHSVAPGTRITLQDSKDFLASSGFDSDDEEAFVPPEAMDTPSPQFGPESHGRRWVIPSTASEDSKDIVMERWGVEESADSDASFSSLSSLRSASPEPDMEMEEASCFYGEVLESVRSGIAEEVSSENLTLEINASKHAYNIPIADVPLAVVKAILEGPPTTGTPGQAKELLAYVKSAFTSREEMLKNYIKTEATQIAVLEGMADFALLHPNILSIFARVIVHLYDMDIMGETQILQWYEGLKGEERNTQIVDLLQPVITWLQNAEEESEEDSD